MEDKRALEIFDNRLFGEVVMCRPQPSGRDDKLGPLECPRKGFGYEIDIIAHCRTPKDLRPGLGDFSGDKGRVGVDDMTE